MTHSTHSPAQPSPSSASLAWRARDQACNLTDVLNAYTCVELLVAPVGSQDAEDIHATRDQLSSLLRVINEEFERRIEAVTAAIDTTHSAITRARSQSLDPEETED